jgi:uncharacterized membrane protein YqjE
MTDSIGLMASLKRLTGTLLAILQTRLELLSSEMEEERVRIEQILLYGSIVLFFTGLAIMLLTAFFVVLLWDEHRLLVLGGFSASFFLVALLALAGLRRVAREKCKLFSVSLAELASDRDSLAHLP